MAFSMQTITYLFKFHQHFANLCQNHWIWKSCAIISQSWRHNWGNGGTRHQSLRVMAGHVISPHKSRWVGLAISPNKPCFCSISIFKFLGIPFGFLVVVIFIDNFHSFSDRNHRIIFFYSRFLILAIARTDELKTMIGWNGPFGGIMSSSSTWQLVRVRWCSDAMRCYDHTP